MTCARTACLICVHLCLSMAVLLPHAAASAAEPGPVWLDPAWPLRRPIDVDCAAERATGQEIVVADLYTGGSHLPDGSDLRVTTPAGQPLAIRVLMVGPGDRVRIAFPAVRNTLRYYAYFGNPKPPALKPEMADIPRTAGLLMEMRELATDQVTNFEDMEKAWQASTRLIGRTLIDHASIGVNPFGGQQRTISRFEGTFPVGFDGEYVFALAADDRAAVFIDGQPVVFSASGAADVRVNGSIALKQGNRSLVIYHVNLAGDGRFATAIRRAETERWQALSADVLGRPLRGSAGPLQELRKTLVADFAIDYQGEAFFAGGYSHRYQFTAHAPAVAGQASYAWDFGDGQTATGPTANHVFVADGIYPVQLTVRVGNSSDVRRHRLSVSRDWEWSDRPTEEPLDRHALIVSGYQTARLPAASLPRAAMLLARAGRPAQALAAAARLPAEAARLDPAGVDQAFDALTEAASLSVAGGRTDVAVALWQAVPASSPLQPRASLALARLQLWRQGDAKGAARTMANAPSTDLEAKRAQGQALVLAGQPDEGRKVLEALPPAADPAKRAAISGASARTVEFYISTEDADAGDEAWDLWLRRYPAEFLQGYAVLLKVKLIELQKAPLAAANVAEAFARAVPGSAYSAQLLDRASRLLEPIDASRSAALRKLLKERYPEDPLAQ